VTRGASAKSNEENLPQMYLNEARGWVRQNWISAKKWFYKKVVLRDDYVPQFDDFSEANKNRNKTDTIGRRYKDNNDGLSDFDYSYGIEESYAYAWYVFNKLYCDLM
jgi:hypothetical protein